MAGLAVGLSKTVVEGALAKVQSAIGEDSKLRQKAQRDLVVITLEFEMIQSFLSVTNEEMSAMNNLVASWVTHVRELAYDLEDCVEFVVHLDDKPIFWRRLLPPCLVAPLPLDQAVAEIEDIKGRAEELSKCYLRYSHITDSAGSKLVMLQLQQQASSRAAAITASNMLSEARDATRKWKCLRDLTQMITNNKEHPQLQVISVWGSGGDHGMTSIIRKAYQDPEICMNFPCRAWVKLMHPFNPHEFVRLFMAQVYANAREDKGGSYAVVHFLTKMEAKQQDLLKEFVHQVNNKTYLVVLENLSDMVDWDAVRMLLPDVNTGSRIIVSTQQSEIASLCIGRPYQVWELKQFTAEHSVCALFKEGSQDYRVKDNIVIECPVIPTSRIASLERATITDWMEKYPLVGRESEKNELNACTARARFISSQVISVWGIPGIGKSALVRNVYYGRMLDSYQFNIYSWVTVSHPFNLRDFCRSILSDFHSEKDPIKECHELLKQNNCLLVVDDLKTKEEWDLIQSVLVSRGSRSVIVVITTEASVATYFTESNVQVINVKPLETDAAYNLFRNEVQRKMPSITRNIQRGEEVQEVILKCGGLPEVIVSIAALMVDRTTWMDVRSLNRKFMHHLETNRECDSLRGLFGWINSYLRSSSDSLKPCILYLPIFPPENIIRRKRLVRRWIAEGYARDNNDKSAEERAEMFFSQLIDLSIIHQPLQKISTSAAVNTKMSLYQVNRFICEYIVSRRVEENLVFELGGGYNPTYQRSGRHLVIWKSWDRNIVLFKTIDFSRLRSLTVFGRWESFFVCKSMKTIRVVDLENASGVTDGDLVKIVKLLHRLKFLSLRGQREICHLPSSLGYLRQLQTLDVRGTSIVALPESITKLDKLQYIRAGSNNDPAQHHQCRHSLVSVEVPRGIGNVTALHTLGVVNVPASGGKALVEELKKLTQLRKIGLTDINRKNNAIVSTVSGHVHLESLLVCIDKDNQCCLEDISLPWRNLRSLKLYGIGDKLPESIKELSDLTKLYLEMATLMQRDVELLGNLPQLCIMRLDVKQPSLHFYSEIYGQELVTYAKVKILEISCSSSRLHVTFGSSSMKNLELLKLDCSSASYQLTGLNYLSKLKQVVLKGTNDETIKTDLESQLANHPKTPAVKLEEVPLSS